VPLDSDALSAALDSIAATEAPPARIDVDRARAEGRRILRGRRAAAASLGGAGALGLAVAATLAATLSAGHSADAAVPSPSSTLPRTADIVHTSDWDPLIAPGTFGWLPDNAQNVNYSVAPGPGQGPAALGKGSLVSNGEVGHDPAMIWLSVLPDSQKPKAGPLNDGSDSTLVAAPAVNGRTAFWAVTPKKPNPDQGAAGALYFQSPTGRWATISAYYLGADPVAATLLHVAASAHLVDTPVPLPIRITGLPATARGEVAEVSRPTTIAGAAWSVDLGFALGNGTVSVSVYPASAVPASGTSFGKHCDANRNGLRICVDVIGGVDPKLLPGGLDGLLHGITSLGPDLASWTTDVVVVTH
jgi:hypothetical protein